ncbi:MAG: tripartite tricarboxylate transporter TctB family protein [Deltaproteobacteria bacterium]|nr:tripartite tricarboxylate transporter TctB family protein [Deltaproteobacteria bacterium]
MRRREITASISFLVLALVSLEEALKLPVGNWKVPGPGFFPIVLGFVVLALAASSLGAALVQGKTEPSPVPLFVSSTGKRRVWLAVSALIGFNLLVDVLGFLLTTFLFLVVVIRLLSCQHWKILLSISFLLSVFLYVLLDLFLKLPLPKGSIGF